jgi:hypothetical protein
MNRIASDIAAFVALALVIAVIGTACAIIGGTP